MYDEKEKDEKPKIKCKNCQRECHEGHDVIRIQRGVVGLSGVIVLDDNTAFCGDPCLYAYYSEDEVQRLSRRIP